MAQQQLCVSGDATATLNTHSSSPRQQHSINTMLDLCNIAAIKIAIDVGLFDCLSRQGEKSVGIEDLSRITKVEARLLRELVAALRRSEQALTWAD